jgi:prolyl 4-hydroxylase
MMAKILADPKYLLPTSDLKIYCIPSLLDPLLCEKLIECIDRYCVPSTVTVGEKMVRTQARTSSTCRLEEWPHYKSEVKMLQKMILSQIDVDIRHSEPLQGQRYRIGEFYGRHTDFFTPKTSTYQAFTETGGQRTWTAMFYLNDVINGGATLFPTIDLAITPTVGTMLLWDNMNHLGKENYYAMHEALAPVSNSKYVVTQWFRQNYWR